jgi:acyl-CoA synthetase (AMP-forming)/AMP-acid ligase II
VPITCNPTNYRRTLTSVGPPAGPAVLLLDDDGVQVKLGEQAEVCCNGANVMPGYERREHQSKDPNIEAFHHKGAARWLRTGDKGYADENGFITLTGRFKEIINRGGEKLAPIEVCASYSGLLSLARTR